MFRPMQFIPILYLVPPLSLSLSLSLARARSMLLSILLRFEKYR